MLVFSFPFFIPICNYIMWSVCSLKVNMAVFNWSDFTHNCMILSTTFGFHFVWISRLISESILKINQYSMLNIEVQKLNNWENVNLLSVMGSLIINKNSKPKNDSTSRKPSDVTIHRRLLFFFSLKKNLYYINKNRVWSSRVPDLLKQLWLQPPVMKGPH